MDYSLFTSWFSTRIPVIHAEESTFPLKFYSPKSLDSTTLVVFLVGLFIVILTTTIFMVKYQRWKKYNQFLDEMRSLDLDPSSEGTFAWMVKRYQMNEPLKVLQSPQVFDEMATGEIIRVLCSAGTAKAKEDFIDTVYAIRKRTFHADRFFSDSLSL